MFGSFPNLIVVSPQLSRLNDVLRFVEDDDIVLIHWRAQNHTIIPDFLQNYMDYKKKGESRARFRLGILHTANERNRMNWPWYVNADFVIRNYWVNAILPGNVQYIPLGPQYPHLCSPTELQETPFKYPRSFQVEVPDCSCRHLSITPASNRPFLWSFSGSMRRNRGRLLDIIKQREEIKDDGFVLVARQFGGDGLVGSKDPSKNPKTEHLKLIGNSKFVFCPCGNVMETHRIYETIILGAIPVIENCEPELSNFFPIPELLFATPKEMVQFVVNFKNRPKDIGKMQTRLIKWWKIYVQEIRKNVSKTVMSISPEVVGQNS